MAGQTIIFQGQPLQSTLETDKSGGRTARNGMAETWAKNRRGKPPHRDRFTKIDALAARRVLRDAFRARHELAQAFKADDAAVHRLRW